MKYKLLKDSPWAKAGTIVNADFTKSGNGNISYSFIAQTGEYEGKEIWQGWYPKQYQEWSDWFEEVDERWKPEVDNIYFYVSTVCDVRNLLWYSNVVDQDKYNAGNCFRTRELAERAAEKIKALLKEFHKNNP